MLQWDKWTQTMFFFFFVQSKWTPRCARTYVSTTMDVSEVEFHVAGTYQVERELWGWVIKKLDVLVIY